MTLSASLAVHQHGVRFAFASVVDREMGWRRE
jgi:hypothetical protein